MKPKFIFMGSPEISVPFLKFLARKNAEIIVFTQKDKIRGRGNKLVQTPVKSWAVENNIAVYDVSAKSQKAFEIISEFKPDLFLVVAYGQILPERLLALPAIAPINVHFSLLPSYRGATPVNTALLEGVKETGTTLMFMNKDMDAGDIIYSAKTAVDDNDNATALFEKLTAISLELLDINWENIISGKIERTIQSGEITYTKMIVKDDLIIDWSGDCRVIHNKIRAFNYEPGVKTGFHGKGLSILEAAVCPENSGEAGRIISTEKNSFTVACGTGAIKILKVKPEGKNAMPASAFIAGYKPMAGEMLAW